MNEQGDAKNPNGFASDSDATGATNDPQRGGSVSHFPKRITLEPMVGQDNENTQPLVAMPSPETPQTKVEFGILDESDNVVLDPSSGLLLQVSATYLEVMEATYIAVVNTAQSSEQPDQAVDPDDIIYLEIDKTELYNIPTTNRIRTRESGRGFTPGIASDEWVKKLQDLGISSQQALLGRCIMARPLINVLPPPQTP